MAKRKNAKNKLAPAKVVKEKIAIKRKSFKNVFFVIVKRTVNVHPIQR